jgi:hypothetical protein
VSDWLPVVGILLVSIVFRIVLQRRWLNRWARALLSVVYAYLLLSIILVLVSAAAGTLPYGLMLAYLLLVWSVPALLLQVSWTVATQMRQRVTDG